MCIYFNHSAMEKTSIDKIYKYLDEIILLKTIVRENEEQLYFYQDFWNVSLNNTNLKDYLFNISDKQYVKQIIDCVMNGPYYYKKDVVQDLNINPEIKGDTFANTLLRICYSDKQKNVLSLEEEKILTNDEYDVKDNKTDFIVYNLLGKETLGDFFINNNEFKNIKEVFNRINDLSKNIVILDEARKSAKKHEFRGHFKEIFESIVMLEKYELPMILNGVNDETRIKEFLLNTGYEISKESEETLKIERFKKEREFNIPGLEKKIFTWHIKIDGGHTRIHYYIDKENKKIYIGHCGKHLKTVAYSS